MSQHNSKLGDKEHPVYVVLQVNCKLNQVEQIILSIFSALAYLGLRICNLSWISRLQCGFMCKRYTRTCYLLLIVDGRVLVGLCRLPEYTRCCSDVWPTFFGISMLVQKAFLWYSTYRYSKNRYYYDFIVAHMSLLHEVNFGSTAEAFFANSLTYSAPTLKVPLLLLRKEALCLCADK